MIAGAQDELVEVRGRLFPQVGDLNRLALCEDWGDVRVVKANMPLRKSIDQSLIHSVSGAQTKLACLLIIAVDGASLGTRELHCLCDDGGKHSFDVERRIHRLGHLAKRL